MKFRGEFGFLSNFWACDIAGYPSVEHFYQAMKVLDKGVREAIRRAETPGKAKRMVRRFELREDWDEIKLEVMRYALRIKFSDPKLLARLKSIEVEIVEHNTWGDTFWGVCDGIGENHLGKLLMEVRDERV